MTKSTLAVALVAAAAFGGMKTYDAYAPVSQSDLLLAENVEALSGESDPGILDDLASIGKNLINKGKQLTDPCYINGTKMKPFQCESHTKETTETTNTSIGATIPIKGVPVGGSIGHDSKHSEKETTYDKREKHECSSEEAGAFDTCYKLDQTDCNGNKTTTHC